MIQALLWDVDGTLAETERDGHLPAFNDAFADLGMDWRWSVERYGELLRTTGGRERLLRDMADRPDAPSTTEQRLALAQALHRRKNERYAERLAAGLIGFRPGVMALLEEALSAGIPQAIVTTTSCSNVQALLDQQIGIGWKGLFAAVVCGEDVPLKKPAPDAYLLALQALRVQGMHSLAIEDSPGGAAAAKLAGIPVVVTRSVYFPDDALDEVLAVGPGFDRRDGWQPSLGAAAGPVRLADLQYWHFRGELFSHFT